MKKKPCLVIGPMGPNFMRDLTWLANEVVKPILENIEPGGFTVSTPSFQKIGNVMYQVIQACDRAATGGGKSYGQQSKRPLRNGSPGCYGPRLRPPSKSAMTPTS